MFSLDIVASLASLLVGGGAPHYMAERWIGGSRASTAHVESWNSGVHPARSSPALTRDAAGT